MDVDELGLLTVGTLVPEAGGNTLSRITLLVITPWSRKPPLIVGSPVITFVYRTKLSPPLPWR